MGVDDHDKMLWSMSKITFFQIVFQYVLDNKVCYVYAKLKSADW